MKCPYCTNLDTKVVDSRLTDVNDSVRRRRECERCGKRFTTYERIEAKPIAVIKKDNTREPFDHNKTLSGLIRACIKRNISVGTLNELVDDIENEITDMPGSEINSRELTYNLTYRNLLLDHNSIIPQNRHNQVLSETKITTGNNTRSQNA